MSSASPRLQARGLCYTYPGATLPALAGIDLSIEPGEYLAIVGANGSGKSTLLRLLVGLAAPSSGELSVSAGGFTFSPAADPVAARRLIGFVPQNADDHIVGSIVEEDVAFGPENLGLPPGECRARTAAALAAVGLTEAAHKPPHALSGGERQRVAIAGALAMDNPALLFDEPAAMLDPPSRRRLLGLLDTLKSGRSILHVTHDLAEAARADRVVVLCAGKTVFDGNPQALLARGDLADWGLVAPDSALAARALAGGRPDLAGLPSLDPADFARLWTAGQGRVKPDAPATVQTEIRSALTDAAAAVAVPTSDASPAAPAFACFAAAHEYLRGTAFAARGLIDCSLSVPRGARVALVGASGSGKSTLLRLAAALLLPSAGRVRTLGLDPTDRRTNLRALRLRATYAPQQPESALFEPYLADDVAYGPRNAGLAGTALVAAVRAAMDQVGLPYADFRDRASLALSGGEKRKAALAGVMAMSPELMLLDEPTAGLDGPSRERILDSLLALPGGATLIASTHSMEEAARFDYAAVVADGRLAAFGPPRRLFGAAWDESWGLDRPWAAAAAAELPGGGGAWGWPLTVAELSAALCAGGPQPEPASAASEFLPPAATPDVSLADDSSPAPSSERSAVPSRQKTRPRRSSDLEFLRNVTFGQYLDRPSPLQRLGIGTKTLLLLAAMAGVLAVPVWWAQIAVLAAILAGGAAFARIGPRHLLRGFLPALPFFMALVALQIILYPAAAAESAVWRWWLIDLTWPELGRAVLLVWRMAALMAALTLFSATTPLAGLTGAMDRALAPLARRGWPVRSLSLAAGICLRCVPVLVEEAERIAVAQLARGAPYTGRGRLRAALSIAVPFFLRALERAERLAIAMELRLFSAVR